jgi:alkanesulfonate monooxygenase SsuD/methylene tetrahydromethanopterin reductase-like flavin-dependent oxidoreductase (luciferase family)
MTLAGEVADAVILTWSFAEEVEISRGILRASSAAAGHEAPDVISYVRCALMPGAERAVARRADVYDAIPHYRAVFARYGITAADTVVTGSTRAELLEGIEREEEVLDIGVIRAIPVENTVDSLAELVTACAP